MPASFMTLFPVPKKQLEHYRNLLEWSAVSAETASICLGNTISPVSFSQKNTRQGSHREIISDLVKDISGFCRKLSQHPFQRFTQNRQNEIEYLETFIKDHGLQSWSAPVSESDILLDLPGMRLIDISVPGPHKVENYTVVFAPRAGHHSNIAERVALYLRDQGLTRMAIVEQKCADDIPMYIKGKRHYENFDGQIKQYTDILKYLKNLAGVPSHLIGVCQPGPLLITALILNPDLGKTFGSSGSPMDTEAQRSFLTDMSRLAGESYIDILIHAFSRKVSRNKPGAGRLIYDGRLHALGFYLMAMDIHVSNFKHLFRDLKAKKRDNAERQKAFYKWFNTVNHFPAGFVRDTYKRIFVRNELARGQLKINGQAVRYSDYPSNVPIWSIAGKGDSIAPPRQANAHLDQVSVPEELKLNEICNGGHMALFRSQSVLEKNYRRIAEFILKHSDLSKGDQT
jgi:polyhydroxyalkanoate depolymerase